LRRGRSGDSQSADCSSQPDRFASIDPIHKVHCQASPGFLTIP
jgi:hypothetical protein